MLSRRSLLRFAIGSVVGVIAAPIVKLLPQVVEVNRPTTLKMSEWQLIDKTVIRSVRKRLPLIEQAITGPEELVID